MYIMADIGGTKTRIAASRDLAAFGEPIIFTTPSNYEEGIQRIVEAARQLAAGEAITGMACGMRGVLSHDHRALVQDTKLVAWGGHALADDLGEKLSTKVVLENDTAMVGLGEAYFGAGKGASIVAYITISTGVGGVRITDGVIDRTSEGFEIGGQYLNVEGEAQTFEDLVSGAAVEKKYGMHPKDLGHDSPVWDELARITAFCVHTTILHWSPDRVVFGGSMFNETGIKVDRVHFYAQEIMQKHPTIPEFAHATLGDFGGLWGGMRRLQEERGE
jgi:predicted NBD/HSP70 family sugar kinase